MPGSLIKTVLTIATRGLPKRIIRDKSDHGVYLTRYYLIRTAVIEIVIHHILRADGEKRLHDHPWNWAFSLILVGSYLEERSSDKTRVAVKVFRPGQINLIRSATWHRIADLLSEDVWTLFVHGPRVQSWSFGSKEADAADCMVPRVRR